MSVFFGLKWHVRYSFEMTFLYLDMLHKDRSHFADSDEPNGSNYPWRHIGPYNDGTTSPWVKTSYGTYEDDG